MITSEIVGGAVICGGIGIAALLAWASIHTARNRQKQYRALLASGFRESYALHGPVIFAFDKSNREFAVVYSDAVCRYRFDQISSWRHEWDTKNGVHVNNKFIINVLDTDRPIHQTRASHSACSHWVAKLNALVNG